MQKFPSPQKKSPTLQQCAVSVSVQNKVSQFSRCCNDSCTESFLQRAIYTSSFYTDANVVWPIPYLFYKTHYVFIPNPWLETSLSDSVSSLPLITGAASKSIIHTRKPHAVFSCILPLLTLGLKAGIVGRRRWEKTSPAVWQICLFTFWKVKVNDEAGNNDIFLPVISVATVTLLQISAPDNRCIHFMTLWKYKTGGTYTWF